jgi:hypothetical protein
MVRLGFQGAELAALEEVLAEADALKQIEQVAFAATQGLYDPLPRLRLRRAAPPQLAVKLVHGLDYDRQHARVAVAVARLMEQADQRTGRQVEEARQHLRNWIIAVIAAMASAALLVLFGLRTTRSKVLSPLRTCRRPPAGWPVASTMCAWPARERRGSAGAAGCLQLHGHGHRARHP